MESGYRRFYRVRKGKILLGLMQGLGEYFKIDPIILRVALILIMFLAGAGLAVPILYFIVGLCIPYAPENES